MQLVRKELKSYNILMTLLRTAIILLLIATVVPTFNPVRMSGLINKNSALLTLGISYSSVAANFTRALSRGWVEESTLRMLYFSSLILSISIAGMAAGWCLSLGKIKLQRLGVRFAAIGSAVAIPVLLMLIPVYQAFSQSSKPDKIQPMFAEGFWLFLALLAICLVLSVLNMVRLPKPASDDKYEMESKYKLFLMILPFVILTFLFAYLPLWGWRYSFYNYKPGIDLSADNFAGFKWFAYLFRNAATRADIIRVIKNTLAMSGIGIATSWLPMAFAIFLSEIKAGKTRKIVQTVTTVPNFISWVLVYTFAFSLFSTEGFVNSALIDLGLKESATNYLMSGEHIWLKMWAWGTWKGLGWSAIIYIAGISGIDPQLYEAATIDGAGRFRRMWHVTVPGLLPTFSVLMLLSVASILSNGMDQYFVFKNSANKSSIEVLDLFVYTLGLGKGGSGNIPLATVVGMLKSIISVTLLFGANKISKLIRGESIV